MKRNALLVVLSLLLLAGCSRGTGARPTPTPVPTPVRPVQPTYTVQRGDVVVDLAFNARVVAGNEANLFFRRDGFVSRVFVQAGDDVKKGDILAELDVPQLQRSLAKAQHDLQAAERALDAAKQSHQDDLTKAEWQLQMAQAALEDARAEASSQLTIARQELAKLQEQDPAPRKAQAKAMLEQARIRLQQAQAAYDAVSWRNDLSATSQAAQLQQATLAYQEAKASYDLAMQAVATHANDLAIQKERVAQARRRLERLQDEAVDTPEEQALAEARLQLDILKRGLAPSFASRVEDARFQVEDLQAQMEEARIRAPRPGRIVSLSISPGQAVQAHKAVVILADPNLLEATAQLTADGMGKLREGQPVTITLAGRPGPTLAGHIGKLPYPYGSGSPGQGDAKPVVHISFDADPISAGLHPGDLVQAQAVLAVKKGVLWLPPAAIRTFGGRQFVVVQEGTLRRRVDVTLGLKGEKRVEIVSGLKEGQVVIGP